MIHRSALPLLVGILVSIPSLSIASEDICAIPGTEFASCKADYRAFHSVVVAIHGWNGSCAETFGDHDHSLLATIRHRSAFDVDCFGYDTHDTSIAVSADQLRTKIGELVELGYDDFLFVTHSMGGIVLLEMLMEDALTPDKAELKDAIDRGLLLGGSGAHIASVHAWAVPIRGLRDEIALAGGVKNFFGFDRATLPELAPDSPLLSSLNKALQNFFRLRNGADPTDRDLMRLSLTLYQGQEDDWVVANVPSNDALIADNPDSVRIILTADGHSHNVADGGTVTDPKYPQELMRDKTLLTVSLEPRFEEIFRADLPSAPASLLSRQDRVIEGTIQFCIDNFMEAIAPVANLVARLMQGQFVRSAQLDLKLVDRFARLIEDQTARLINTKDFADLVQLYQNIVIALGSYDPKDKNSDLDFGQGNGVAIDRVVKVFRFIVDHLPQIARLSEAEGKPVDPQAMIQLQAGILALAPRYMYAGHDSVRTDAIEVLQLSMRDAPLEAIESSSVVDALSRFMIANAVDLPEAEKHALADTLLVAKERDPSQRDKVFAALTSDANGATPGTKLWAVIMDNNRVDETLDGLPLSYQVNDPEFRFLVGVVERGGATGNSSSSALKALDIAQAVVDSKSKTEVGQIRLGELRSAVESSAFPRVARKFDLWRPQGGF